MLNEFLALRAAIAHGQSGLKELTAFVGSYPFQARVRETQLLALLDEANRRLKELGGEEVSAHEVLSE